jgi:hypothetical protein
MIGWGLIFGLYVIDCWCVPLCVQVIGALLLCHDKIQKIDECAVIIPCTSYSTREMAPSARLTARGFPSMLGRWIRQYKVECHGRMVRPSHPARGVLHEGTAYERMVKWSPRELGDCTVIWRERHRSET